MSIKYFDLHQEEIIIWKNYAISHVVILLYTWEDQSIGLKYSANYYNKKLYFTYLWRIYVINLIMTANYSLLVPVCPLLWLGTVGCFICLDYYSFILYRLILFLTFMFVFLEKPN